MFIDDTAGISLAEMRAKARRLKQNAGGLDLIVVDYLQLMSATLPSSGRKNYENRTQEVSAISRGLKALSKELDVPVVASPSFPRQQQTGRRQAPHAERYVRTKQKKKTRRQIASKALLQAMASAASAGITPSSASTGRCSLTSASVAAVFVSFSPDAPIAGRV